MKKLCVLMSCLCLTLAGCGSKKDDVSKNSGKEKFTVGMECAYAPFNWQSSEQSETSVSIGAAGFCDGYDVMVSRYIADQIGQEVEVKKVAWDGLQASMNSGEIDAIVAGMTKDEKREKGIDFTSPYYESSMVMIVRNDDPLKDVKEINGFANKNVLGQKSTNYDTVIDQIKDVKHMTPKATYPEMVLALQSKEADGITAEMPVALGVVKANPDLVIVQFDEGKGFDVDPSVSIGMKKGSKDEELFKAVQKAVSSITKFQQEEWMKKSVETQPSVK